MSRFAITGLLTVSFSIFPVLSQASVREDQRTCQFGYWKTLKRGAPPPRTDNADEQYCTGLAYWFQPSPLQRDPASAAPWYDAAAKQGQLGAMVALGYQYEKGYGVGVDAGKAFELYQRAAERGSPDAMFNVFRLYTTGKGVKADAGQARKWLEKAAAAGSIDAKKELMEVNGGDDSRPGQDAENAAYAAYSKKDYATSARLYRQASDQGNMDAMVALGQLYRQGFGVAKDMKEAARLFRIAAEKAIPLARPSLGWPMRAARAWRKTGRKCAACANNLLPNTTSSGSTA
jgi:TPR repeat protein